jgi:hypothetical protein
MRRTDDRADYVLECWPAVMNGMLRVRWTFSERLHQRETIERLANDFLDFLRALVMP